MDPSAIAGASLFLGSSAALVYAGTLAGVVREALRPERRTVAWALSRGSPSDPAAWGLPVREWSHGFRGASCPVFDLGVEEASAPTAIVLHGFARSRYDALARLGPILPHVGRVLLPDLPGHGDAIGRGTRLGTDEDIFLESLAESATSGPLLLVGHSLGATIAIAAATRDAIAARCVGVVALAPYERLRTPLGARLELRSMPKAPLLGPAISVLGALGVAERSSREAAALLRCPLAVVAGEEDPVTPLAEARAIAEKARTGRFFSVPLARHDDFSTLGRTQVADALGWLHSARA